jgi:hypothetical protein
VSFDLEEFLGSVRTALENNMKDSDSPLLLDKDFRVDIAIYAGDYDKKNKVFTSNVNYVGMWPLFLREN